MSKHEITHACGHTVTHNIIGSIGEKCGKAAWLAERDCPKCWAENKAAERRAEQDKTREVADGLPAMTGTEKQVAWAEQIRADAYSTAKGKFERLAEDARKRAVDTLDYYVGVETSAKFWIDNKGVFMFGEGENRFVDVARMILEIAVLHPETDARSEQAGALKNVLAEREKRFGKQGEQQLAKAAKGSRTFVVPAHAIARMEYIQKVGKYVAEIEFHGHAKKEFWVSEKQAKSIDEAFAGERYSTKANQAYVILEDAGERLRLVWAAQNRAKAEKSAEYFGADWGWPGEGSDEDDEGGE
jgi:hypothetical protein